MYHYYLHCLALSILPHRCCQAHSESSKYQNDAGRKKLCATDERATLCRPPCKKEAAQELLEKMFQLQATSRKHRAAWQHNHVYFTDLPQSSAWPHMLTCSKHRPPPVCTSSCCTHQAEVFPICESPSSASVVTQCHRVNQSFSKWNKRRLVLMFTQY